MRKLPLPAKGLAAWAAAAAITLSSFEATAEPPVVVTLVGDIMLDGGPGHLAANGIDPFAQVAELLMHSDVTIGNLECAITREGHAQDKTYTFKGPKASLPLIKKYFSAVSLANNHSGDWGKAGFVDELRLLRDWQIPWFGGGINVQEARRPFVVEKNGQRFAVLGYNDFPPRAFGATTHQPGTAWLVEKDVICDIVAARRATHADWVLLYLHWGEELETTPTNEQVQMAHHFLEAGADVVVGGHPHVTQTIDWYQGKPIIYSLGNFLFDYFPGDPLVWKSYMLQLKFLKGAPIGLETIPIELDSAGVPHLTLAR